MVGRCLPVSGVNDSEGGGWLARRSKAEAERRAAREGHAHGQHPSSRDALVIIIAITVTIIISNPDERGRYRHTLTGLHAQPLDHPRGTSRVAPEALDDSL